MSGMRRCAVLTLRRSLPFCADKRTFSESVGMSQACRCGPFCPDATMIALSHSSGYWAACLNVAALAWGFLPIDHREDCAGEIVRGIHQLVCASSFKFVSGTITPEHAKTAHSDRMGAGNIISAIPDHHTVRRRKTMFRQNMGEQFRLVIELAARH